MRAARFSIMMLAILPRLSVSMLLSFQKVGRKRLGSLFDNFWIRVSSAETGSSLGSAVGTDGRSTFSLVANHASCIVTGADRARALSLGTTEVQM
jgi:hypothetical protein